MSDNIEHDLGANVLPNPRTFLRNIDDVLYKIEEHCDAEGLVSYIISANDKKLASLFLEDDDFSYDKHNRSAPGADVMQIIYKEILAERTMDEEANKDTSKIPLSAEEFYRLNFAEDDYDQWSDIDNFIMLAPAKEGGYKQYVLDTNDEQIFFGKSLKTVAELQQRYLSVSGYELKRNNSDRPITGQ